MLVDDIILDKRESIVEYSYMQVYICFNLNIYNNCLKLINDE